jgi:hypothetical protein
VRDAYRVLQGAQLVALQSPAAPAQRLQRHVVKLGGDGVALRVSRQAGLRIERDVRGSRPWSPRDQHTRWLRTAAAAVP